MATVQPLTPAQLARLLRGFEVRYHVPSVRLIDAFMVDGRLVETDDFHEWASLYSVFQAVKRELAEQMRIAYHASKPRWDAQQRCSMHTGMEAALEVALAAFGVADQEVSGA